MIRRPPRSTLSSSSAASDVYKRQLLLVRGRDATSTTKNSRSLNQLTINRDYVGRALLGVHPAEDVGDGTCIARHQVTSQLVSADTFELNADSPDTSRWISSPPRGRLLAPPNQTYTLLAATEQHILQLCRAG
eukprot:TRINITY_DN3014_c0_g2_i1.p1 TRINITY_DN3014_c0_g2~~TRINITY_DN3014_c0_g2_i1.p1  ORF type:complete len:133 (+),score=11.99 TRINITY_DN3014_c0_g2_i1:57-455(+)